MLRVVTACEQCGGRVLCGAVQCRGWVELTGQVLSLTTPWLTCGHDVLGTVDGFAESGGPWDELCGAVQ